MKNELNISVKKPCHQKFENFEQTPLGGFCGSCKKEVIDFTPMSSSEIVRHLTSNSGQICGHFKKSQLNALYSIPDPRQNSHFLSNRIRVMGFSLFTLFAVSNLHSQETQSTNTTVQTELSVSTLQNAEQLQTQEYVVKGTVLDETDSPLPGASIVLKGTSVGTTTGFNGKFEFPRALKEGDILVFNYLGYETKEYKVKSSESKTIDIDMAFESSNIELMGEVVVGQIHSTKRNIFQRFISIFK